MVMVAYHSRHEHKRHGKHQKHTKHFLKVYTPYLPLVLIVSFGLFISVLMPPQSATRGKKDVLAYATSMSVSALLQATNQQRAANGLPALKINSKLSSAAQTKANDMVARNYWAHDPPYPDEYWYEFVNSSGYKYKALGENLAYGFNTSDDTVNGWMASPSHRENMLNGTYKEVGFGYANGNNFNNSGPETIVVAEYALPITVATAPAPVPTPSTGSTKSASSAPATSNTAPTPNTPIAKTTQPSKTPTKAPVTTASTVPADGGNTTVKVSRVAYLTKGNAPWLASSISAILVVCLAALALRHTIAIRKWFKNGERFVLHHAVFDITIISLIGLCYILSQSAGMFVR